MSDLAEDLRRWRADGDAVAMATVIDVDGSVPRGPGAKMLVTASGKVSGSVSGGCVEGAVADVAVSVLADGTSKVVQYGITRDMMWDVGLACGGTIDVFVESLERGTQPSFDPGVTLCTVVRGPKHVGERLEIRHAAGHSPSVRGSTGDPTLDGEIAASVGETTRPRSPRIVTVGDHEVFVDPCTPQQRLIIVGAVHIGVALCEIATKAGFSVTVVDPRAKLNNRERFPAAQTLAVGWPEDELPRLAIDENAYVAVLTHDDKFDDPTLDLVLRGDARYVGAIGSKKTQAKRRKRLIDSGLAADAVDRVHGPIGLDIGADTPEEIAVAILAEMIAAKYARRGTPLKDRDEAHIHA
jgi:xanthine dehydrogenase accessory factor